MTVPSASSTRILAIETSCDETAAAVIDDGRHIRSNVIASQIALHQKYGGVFPEMASRAHIEAIAPTIKQAMDDAGAAWDALTAVAVTKGPGLPGSLVVGVNAAKGVCLAYDLPLIGINHLEGHLYSHWLVPSVEAGRVTNPPYSAGDEQEFPILGLLVSGGHTELVLVKNHGEYELIGHTVDDAAGEAFDKVARMLGLGYPGGPAIEHAAVQGNPRRFRFSRPRMDRQFDFSFSGVKTAAYYLLRDFGGAAEGKPNPRVPVSDIAASFQDAVVDWLVEKTARAAQQYNAKAVLVGGGVSANRLLRERMMTALPMPVMFPPLSLCTDNAAMIGAAAHFAYLRGVRDGLDMDVEPDLKIG